MSTLYFGRVIAPGTAIVAVIVAVSSAANCASVSPPEIPQRSPPADKRLSTAAGRVEAPRQALKIRSLKQCVADAKVIVVGTAVDSNAAPPHVVGDLSENFIWFRVNRVLKGQLTAEWIVTRTPTSAKEFIGRDWVIMLSPEYIAGKHFYAGCLWIKAEPEVKAILKATAATSVKESVPTK